MKVIVTDESIHDAVEYLRDSALKIAEARGRMIKSGHMLKVVRAMIMSQHNDKSAAKAEVIALASPEYLKALTEDADATMEFEKLKSLRDAASMRIEVWRSQSSNIRASARL